MPTAASASGGAAKRRKKPAKKTTAKKPAKKSTAKKSTGPTVEQLKKQAKRQGIPLSRNGKAKTKAQLKAAISHHK